MYVKDLRNEPATTGERERERWKSEEISEHDNLESSSQWHITVQSSSFKAIYVSLLQMLEELGNTFTLNK